jgi:hypothetical protein
MTQPRQSYQPRLKDTCASIVNGIKSIIKDEVSVYPNPFNEQMTIQHHGTFTYYIFNMTGKEFERGSFDGHGDVGHHLKTGMYILKMIQNNELKYVKIIKQ